MPNEYKLPFLDRPLVTCYHSIAFPLGIIEENARELNKDITPWIISKYVNPVFSDASQTNAYDICAYDRWCVEEGILSQQYMNMYKATYDILNIDIIKWVSRMIREGCYISGAYNEKYIPGKSAYRVTDYVHDYILYGIDEEKEVFYSAGYLKDRRYRSFEIACSDFMKSIDNMPDIRIPIDFWIYNRAYEYRFDQRRVLQELNDYVNSSNSHSIRRHEYYGIEANRKLKELFLHNIDTYENPGIDLRYTRGYMEHKYFVRLCIMYLCDNRIVDVAKLDLEKVDGLYQDAVLIHRLGIKMNFSKEYKIMNRIAVLFDKIQTEEIKIMNDVIRMME